MIPVVPFPVWLGRLLEALAGARWLAGEAFKVGLGVAYVLGPLFLLLAATAYGNARHEARLEAEALAAALEAAAVVAEASPIECVPPR